MLISGAGSGIGFAMASGLAASGYRVAAIDKDEEALGRLALAAAESAGEILPIRADLRVVSDCLNAAKEAGAHFGQVDGLINNVGIGVSAIRGDAESNHPSIDEITPAVWDEFFSINVRAAFVLTHAVYPVLKQRGWGRIINITTSYRTMLRVLPYGATKSALEAMSAVWATEAAGSGVTVNVLVPGGPTDTPLIAEASGWDRQRMLRPEIMIPPIRWLVSEEANNTNGCRVTAKEWDCTLSGSDALQRASRRIGWPELSESRS